MKVIRVVICTKAKSMRGLTDMRAFVNVNDPGLLRVGDVDVVRD